MTALPETPTDAKATPDQRWLSQRFAFWRDRLDAHVKKVHEPLSLLGDGDHEGQLPAAFRLRRLFGLTTFETEMLVLATGIEIDSELRAAVARAQGTAALGHVALSYALALRLLPDPHWDALSPAGAVRYWSLLTFDTSNGLANASLGVDERILHFVTGVEAFDERLQGIAWLDDGPVNEAHADRSFEVATSMAGLSEPLVMLPNAIADAACRRDGRALARAVYERGGLQTLWVDTGALGTDPTEIAMLARRIDREAALAPAGIALAIEGDAAQSIGAARLISTLRSPVIALGSLTPIQLADMPGRQALRFTVPAGGTPQSRALPPDVRRAAGRALQQFHVDDVALDQALASLDGIDDDSIDARVWAALRESARGGLETLAQRIDSRATLEDLVVPPGVEAQLREIASQLEQRGRVYEEWGFADRHGRGLGIAALFAGESGTGKTLAAEAIANAAQLDLYRIDLASVVSKYIGETEKNLARVFEAAERSGAVLLFDEADALFGKRSEVKDSHDRYANVEVSYLLQRIESYRGLAILTTNMKSALDRAFLRRIRFVVQFPFPDETARAQIWRRQFPARAPLGAIDYATLSKLQLSGGHIRSVALNAAFQAATQGSPIEQRHLLFAARAEFAKLERSFTPPGGHHA